MTKYIISSITGYICIRGDKHPQFSITTTKDPEQATQFDKEEIARKEARIYDLQNYCICKLHEEVEKYKRRYKSKQAQPEDFQEKLMNNPELMEGRG